MQTPLDDVKSNLGIIILAWLTKPFSPRLQQPNLDLSTLELVKTMNELYTPEFTLKANLCRRNKKQQPTHKQYAAMLNKRKIAKCEAHKVYITNNARCF